MPTLTMIDDGTITHICEHFISIPQILVMYVNTAQKLYFEVSF